MLLYHYSHEKFKNLETLKYRSKTTGKSFTKAEIKEAEEDAEFHGDPGPYYDHISFFVEKLDLDTLVKYFIDAKVEHQFWKLDTPFYEYVVDSKNIKSFAYRFVETPFDMNHMQTKWNAHLSDSEIEKYFADQKRMKLATGEQGVKEGNKFDHVGQRFVGLAMGRFLIGSFNNSADENSRYAAGVPHVMLYPEGGLIKPDKPVTTHTVLKSTIDISGSRRW